MKGPTAAGWLLLLALFLFPLTVYIGVYRSVPAPFVGGGLENCGFVLTPRNPDADPTALALCDPARREATVRFAALAVGNGVLLVAGADLQDKASCGASAFSRWPRHHREVPLLGALVNPHDSDATGGFLVWHYQADVVGLHRFRVPVRCPRLHDGLPVPLFLAVPPSRRESPVEPLLDRAACSERNHTLVP